MPRRHNHDVKENLIFLLDESLSFRLIRVPVLTVNTKLGHVGARRVPRVSTVGIATLVSYVRGFLRYAYGMHERGGTSWIVVRACVAARISRNVYYYLTCALDTL